MSRPGRSGEHGFLKRSASTKTPRPVFSPPTLE
nr:MAG TPA: protein of unknown function (DUF4133) [Caudoviricetes sp.]